MRRKIQLHALHFLGERGIKVHACAVEEILKLLADAGLMWVVAEDYDALLLIVR
jgi:hypothetical protein